MTDKEREELRNLIVAACLRVEIGVTPYVSTAELLFGGWDQAGVRDGTGLEGWLRKNGGRISIDEQDAPGRFLATWDFGGKYSGSVGDSTEFMARGKAAAGAIEWALLLIEKRREKEGEAQGD